MNFETRMSLLRIEGVQQLGEEQLICVTDLQTGSSFHLRAGETVGKALAEFALRWELLSRRSEAA